MRSVLASLALVAACTPDIAPGSYFCGPDAACPEGQPCNEADNKCVLAGSVRPFDCTPEIASEPDDSAETGFTLMNLDCSLPVVIDNCMMVDDPADWVRLAIPVNCTSVAIDARITYPVAFEQLGLSLIDTSTGAELAVDTSCTFQGESGDELRCLAATLTASTTYALGVVPTGDGDCDGGCAFNRYTLRAQLK